jgi:hypothetical protein
MDLDMLLNYIKKMNKPIIISHRGNLNGSRKRKENNPNQILLASSYFDVEIDVWSINKKYFLGHDEPKYKVSKEFLTNKNFWCHAKNKEAFEEMLKHNIHCFWHENDKMTLTSNGLLWMYPENYSYRGVTVWLGKPTQSIPEMWGVCTDYPLAWEKKV